MPKITLTDAEITEIVDSLEDYINSVRNRHHTNDLVRFYPLAVQKTTAVLQKLKNIQNKPESLEKKRA